MNTAFQGSSPMLETHNLSFWYGDRRREKQVLFDISIGFPTNKITALVGPSGCGKTTLLKCFNRMHEIGNTVKFRIDGKILFNGQDLYRADLPVEQVRYLAGMVFQRPNPFPKTIYANVAFGPDINGFRGSMDEIVEEALRRADLWEEVKDRLHGRALSLSGGQQQRLCIARALALEPPVLLLDEPCSALDPIATLHIEDLLREIAYDTTIIIVTHNIGQARRLSDYMAFLCEGELIEFSETRLMSTNPRDERTEAFLMGRLG